MTILLSKYVALLLSIAAVMVLGKKILDGYKEKARRIERHVVGARDLSGAPTLAQQKSWFMEESKGEITQIRIRASAITIAFALIDVAIAKVRSGALLPILIIEAILIPLITFANVAGKIQGELRQRVEIESNLPLEIEKLALYLGSGLSLNSSFYRLAQTSSEQTRPVFTFIAQGLLSGISTNEVLEECYQRFPTESIRRITNLLSGGASGGDLVRVTREEAANQRSARHLGALAKMEKVTQSVWIPITIAALLPGIAIVFIPFFSILTSLKG
ncbi:MAG: type II secretion system F family protein [Actinomycetota bacterium]|nr:type II secretion system F family protein [Actinomycetota bacterium]